MALRIPTQCRKDLWARSGERILGARVAGVALVRNVPPPIKQTTKIKIRLWPSG
jgi:hypothetical protein